jgi:hypothetical protein
MVARKRYGGNVSNITFGGGVSRTKFGGDVAKTAFGGQVDKIQFGLGKTMKRLAKLGTKKVVRKMPSYMKHPVKRMGGGGGGRRHQKPFLPGRTLSMIGGPMIMPPKKRVRKPRYGFTSGMNDVERLAPAKVRREKLVKNPPMNRWNETGRMKAKIAKAFSPRFGVADFDTHMGSIGNPVNMMSPWESDKASRQGTVLPKDMPMDTARVLAQTEMGLFIPRPDHGSVF